MLILRVASSRVCRCFIVCMAISEWARYRIKHHGVAGFGRLLKYDLKASLFSRCQDMLSDLNIVRQSIPAASPDA